MATNKVELINSNCIDVIAGVVSNCDNPIIVTDPPFNIGYKYKTYKDNMDEQEYYEMLENVVGGYHS